MAWYLVKHSGNFTSTAPLLYIKLKSNFIDFSGKGLSYEEFGRDVNHRYTFYLKIFSILCVFIEIRGNLFSASTLCE
jgi:hypothetical protein